MPPDLEQHLLLDAITELESWARVHQQVAKPYLRGAKRETKKGNAERAARFQTAADREIALELQCDVVQAELRSKYCDLEDGREARCAAFRGRSASAG